MFKYLAVFTAILGCSFASVAPIAPAVFAAPGIVTAASSQVVARNYNGLVAAPVVAAAPAFYSPVAKVAPVAPVVLASHYAAAAPLAFAKYAVPAVGAPFVKYASAYAPANYYSAHIAPAYAGHSPFIAKYALPSSPVLW